VQVRTISREVERDPSQGRALTPQRLHAELLGTSVSGARAYLHGALHDATQSQLHRTIRFGQSDRRWLDVLAMLLRRLGQSSWQYREGRTRRFWILETSTRWLEVPVGFHTSEERCAYARGYFDSEGGIPRNVKSRFYVQFVQKDREDLAQVRSGLEGLGIRCGRLHNPSARVDPNLWRFYVLAASHEDFIEQVGSWHPRKRGLLEARKRSRRPG
jgi:hypothetical protein